MLEAISKSCDQTCDSNVLERVLCLLTQASAALKAVTQSLLEVDRYQWYRYRIGIFFSPGLDVLPLPTTPSTKEQVCWTTERGTTKSP